PRDQEDEISDDERAKDKLEHHEPGERLRAVGYERARSPSTLPPGCTVQSRSSKSFAQNGQMFHSGRISLPQFGQTLLSRVRQVGQRMNSSCTRSLQVGHTTRCSASARRLSSAS